MINEQKKRKAGVNGFSENIREVSIRKNFPKPRPQLEGKTFLYCDPPEVILQSK